MRKALAALALLGFALSAHAQTPAIAQYIQQAVAQSGSAITDFYNCKCIKYAFPDALPSGNTILIGVQWGDTTQSITVTDDKGNTYTRDVTKADGTNVNTTEIWRASNVTNGAQKVTITWPTTFPNHAAAVVMQVANLATSTPVDGTCSGPTTPPSSNINIACGTAIVTTVSGDFLFQFGIAENGALVTSFTAGASPWAKLTSDRMSPVDQNMSQWQVQTAAGSITPSFTQAPAANFLTVAAAYKAGTSGGTFGNGHVLAVLMNSDENATGRASPFSVDTPCPTATDAIADVWIGASGNLTGISRSVAGSATFETTGTVNGASGTVRIALTSNASTGPTDVATLTTAAVTSLGDDLLVYCLKTGLAAPFDTATSTTGTASGTGQFSGVTITPSTANGLIVGATGVASNNLDASQITPGIWPPENENNNWFLFYNPTAVAATFKSTPNPAAAPGNFTSQAMSLKLFSGGGGGGGGSIGKPIRRQARVPR